MRRAQRIRCCAICKGLRKGDIVAVANSYGVFVCAAHKDDCTVDFLAVEIIYDDGMPK